jgi:hypothetical protein
MTPQRWFDDRRAAGRRKAILPCVLLLGALGGFLPRPARAGRADPVHLQNVLIDVRVVVTLKNVNQIYHPEGHMTGIRVSEEGLVLCPSFVQRTQPQLLGHVAISWVRYYATRDGQSREARILFGGAEFCLLDFGPGFAGPFVAEEALARQAVGGNHMKLMKASPGGIRAAIVHACRDVESQQIEPRWVVPGCTLTRDWLGALCVSVEGGQIMGVLSAFSISPQDNSVYNFSLDGAPLDIVPDAVVAPLDARHLRVLLGNPRLLQLSRLEWLGIKYAKERTPQDDPNACRWKILSLPSSSLGARCGLQAGDEIIRINEKIMTEPNDYGIFLTAEQAAGRTPVRLTFLRANEQKQCAVLVPDWADSPPTGIEGLGFTVVPVCSAPEGTAEFRVLDITATTMRCVRDLRIGDVIQRVNRKAFRHAGEMQQYVDSVHGELVFEVLRAEKKTILAGEKP